MKTKLLLFLVFSSLLSVSRAQTFQDLPGNEADGDFPSKWDLIEGSAEIRTFDGGKIIYLSNNAIITPLFDSKNYLSEKFSLEFDAYFDMAGKPHGNYEIRFWSGSKHGNISDLSSKGFYNPVQIFSNGVRVTGRINSEDVRVLVDKKSFEAPTVYGDL
jgi:hypothetical protein